MKNNKGFTLIELLAVITIMGILMMVAIPTVSRTIENSRKDTFINTAQKYTDSVKNMWAGDNLSCTTSDGGSYNSSAVPLGTYYVRIDTTSESVPVLLEQGGKSSWGSRDVKGYVKVVVGEKKYLYGDVNVDNSIDASDVSFLRRYTSGDTSVVLNDLQKKLADVNDDGMVNAVDLNLVQRKMVGASVTFAKTYFSEPTLDFYPVLADDIHGINVNDDSSVSESNELVRGDLVMTGATYDKVDIPVAALMCVER